MAMTKVPLIIPVENQVRELDPKLLLACVAAKRGFSSIIGSHRKIDLRIASLPRGLYLCKSFTSMNRTMFWIMSKLGQDIVSWDEEALVHLPDEVYFSRRLSPSSLRYVSHLFAWGQENSNLWRRYPRMPKDKPIHVTGNPRADLLRPQLRPFYEKAANDLRKKHGRYVLINTNFNHVNAFYPGQNLFLPMKEQGSKRKSGKAAKGMNREFAEALHKHKQALFEEFKKLIPELEIAFPETVLVVRPHPTECQNVYRRLAGLGERVTVSGEGNVVPWLMAADALVHNGCTTAVEAYKLGVPAISYRPCVDERVDEGFYGLPNRLSHQCFSQQALIETLRQILAGQLGRVVDSENETLLANHISASDGPLACERIVDVLEEIVGPYGKKSRLEASAQVSGWMLANGRRVIKRLRPYLPGASAPDDFHRHRYPPVTLAQLRRRLSRMQQSLGDDTPLKVEQIHHQIFRIVVGS